MLKKADFQGKARNLEFFGGAGAEIRGGFRFPPEIRWGFPAPNPVDFGGFGDLNNRLIRGGFAQDAPEIRWGIGTILSTDLTNCHFGKTPKSYRFAESARGGLKKGF